MEKEPEVGEGTFRLTGTQTRAMCHHLAVSVSSLQNPEMT